MRARQQALYKSSPCYARSISYSSACLTYRKAEAVPTSFSISIIFDCMATSSGQHNLENSALIDFGPVPQKPTVLLDDASRNG